MDLKYYKLQPFYAFYQKWWTGTILKPPAYILQVPEYDDVYFSADLKYRPEEVDQFAVAKVVDNKKLEQLRRNQNVLNLGVASRVTGREEAKCA